MRFQEQSAEAPAPEARAREPPRRFRIKLPDLHEHGFTDSCANCKHIQRYGKSAPGVQHPETCRQRIIDAISKSPQGQQRLQNYEERTNRYLAEEVEAADALPRNDSAPSDEAVLSGPNIMQQVPAAARRTLAVRPRDDVAADNLRVTEDVVEAPDPAGDDDALEEDDIDDAGMSQGSQEGMDIDMMGAVGAASSQRNRGWNRRASKKTSGMRRPSLPL